MSLLSFCPSDTMKQFLSVLSPPSSETSTLHNANIFSPMENRNALYKKGRRSPSVATLACATEMFSNLHISTSIKLRWNPGSGCRFIRGHSSSGKTAPFSAAYLLRWLSSRNHERWNITEKEPQNRFMTSFNTALFTFSFWTHLSCIKTRQKK